MLVILRAILVLALLPGIAFADSSGPAEQPPGDFPARQYIDSRGCVFLRDDQGAWAPRLSRDGAVICGYPPTLSARGLGGKPRLQALAPADGPSRAELLEQALSQTVITNLRPGELLNDPRPMETLRDLGPEPASSGPTDALVAALRAAPFVRQAMGNGLRPNRRLCELLGYDGEQGNSKLGRDPSQGYCDSLPEADLSRLNFARPVGSGAPKAPQPPLAESADVAPTAPVADPPVPVKAVAGPAPTASAAKPKAQAKPAVAKPSGKNAAQRGKAPASGPGMIPAGARYVQLGTFANPANAERAVQRAQALGYPVLRGKDKTQGREVQIIMAGPFNDRESIVRALDTIRRAGFSDAYPR